MNAEYVVPGLLAVAVGYVLVPATLFTMASARRPHPVTCPADGDGARVTLDPRRAVLKLFRNADHCVSTCSRWPALAGCGQSCRGQLL